MSAIDDKYASPAIAALLGAPSGPEGEAIDGGRYRHYANGSIYWSGGGDPAYEIHGAIAAKYAALGWERSPLGFPTTDETGTPDGVGRYNHFQGGSVYWTPATSAHEVHGPIHDLWGRSGWEAGPGYPITDVVTAPDFANIELCTFSNGTRIANPSVAGQAFVVDHAVGALLVVAPNNDFVAAAEPFISHKRLTGMPTFLHTMPAVDVTALNDAPYQLKGVIAEAYEYLGVRYVMLLGDASLVPTRHRATTGVPADHPTTTWFTPTDFYYADLFGSGPARAVPVGAPRPVVTTPWDTNGNELYDEHHWATDTSRYNPSNVIADPLVSIGRVPAHTPAEAATYLSKVVSYETTEPACADRLTTLTDWNYYHQNGDAYLAQQIIDQAGRFEVDSVGLGWAAGYATPGQLRAGSRWSCRSAAASSRVLIYVGHGGVGTWAAPSDTYGDIDNDNVRTFGNAASLPIVLGAGCQTSPIMTGAAESGPYRGIDNNTHWYSAVDHGRVTHTVTTPAGVVTTETLAAPAEPEKPSPYEFASAQFGGFAAGWLLNPTGGGIAYFGEAAVAPDTPGVDLIAKLVGHLRRGLVLGDVWLKAQEDYRAENAQPDDPIAAPRIYLTYMHLFGDPSLRLW